MKNIKNNVFFLVMICCANGAFLQGEVLGFRGDLSATISTTSSCYNSIRFPSNVSIVRNSYEGNGLSVTVNSGTGGVSWGPESFVGNYSVVADGGPMRGSFARGFNLAPGARFETLGIDILASSTRPDRNGLTVGQNALVDSDQTINVVTGTSMAAGSSVRALLNLFLGSFNNNYGNYVQNFFWGTAASHASLVAGQSLQVSGSMNGRYADFSSNGVLAFNSAYGMMSNSTFVAGAELRLNAVGPLSFAQSAIAAGSDIRLNLIRPYLGYRGRIGIDASDTTWTTGGDFYLNADAGNNGFASFGQITVGSGRSVYLAAPANQRLVVDLNGNDVLTDDLEYATVVAAPGVEVVNLGPNTSLVRSEDLCSSAGLSGAYQNQSLGAPFGIAAIAGALAF